VRYCRSCQIMILSYYEIEENLDSTVLKVALTAELIRVISKIILSYSNHFCCKDH
jgi:hypothetical protein